MAAPETGEGGEVVGGWVVVQPGLPDVFTDVIETIQSFLNALLTILNIILTVLQIVKAFIAGLLDPLVAIIEAIVNEIEGLLNDIRQIGLYIAGDLELEGPEFANIIGGFTAYERRMVARLVDRSDPTRPDFSSRSAVIAIFLYVSVDTTGIAQLVSIIQRIMAFFGQASNPKVTSTPTGLKVAYGPNAGTLSKFLPLSDAVNSGELPTHANISWSMAPTPQGGGFLTPGPKGFLVEVSTERDGLLLAYDTFAKNSTVGEGQNNRIQGLMRDPKTKLPFRMYGGSDLIDITDLEGGVYESNSDGTDRKTRLYAYRDSADNVPISLDALTEGSGSNKKYLLQRTFFVKAGFLSTATPGQGFSVTLAHEDMPWKANFEIGGDGKVTGTADGSEPATTVYVRVSEVTKNFVTALNQDTGPLENEIAYLSTSSAAIVSASQSEGTGNVTFATDTSDLSKNDKGLPSSPIEVTFPASSTVEYIDAVKAALAVLLLSRSDLPVAAEDAGFEEGKALTATGLEEVGRWLFPQLIKETKFKHYGRRGVQPAKARRDILRRCTALANQMYRSTGPLGPLEETVVELAQPLFDFKWSDADPALPDQTILESLQDKDDMTGVGLNPLSVGFDVKVTEDYLVQPNIELERFPGFMQKRVVFSRGFLVGQGSADMSPVVYNNGPAGGRAFTTTAYLFCRNAFTDEVYGAAAGVLNVGAAVLTRPSDDGGWIAIRMFPQGLPPVEAALDEILKFVRSILAGIQGFADIIISYIEFIEARVLELQALILRISGLLNALSGFVLPAVAGLVVTGNGTDGILQGLITADNKPTDTSTTTEIAEQTYGTYGAGVVILAGGLPTVLIEILQAFFPESE